MNHFSKISIHFYTGLFLICVLAPSSVDSRGSDQPSSPLGLLLTWQQDPTTTMTIDWYTHEDGQPSELMYKKLGTEDWLTISGSTLPFPFSDRIIHRVELTELEPDTEYRFQIGEHHTHRKFRTMPVEANRPIRFAAGGDVRHRIEWMEQTNRRVAKYEPDFIVWGGDLAYADGREERAYRWYEFMDATMNTLVTPDGRMIPVLAGIGNHEVRGSTYDRDADHETREGLPPYRQDDESRELMAPYYYNLIAFPGQPGYGVLDFGNYMSVILLDTDHTNPVEGEQTAWLEEILAERQDVPHIFPVYHIPAWPSVRNPEGSRHINIRENWIPLFEEHGVKVVFENHDHAYKRTYPLLNGETDVNGIVYIGDGAWGVGTRQIGGSQNPEDGWQYHGNDPWYLKRASSERHFILGTIHGTHRHFLMVNENGEIIDEYPRTTHTDLNLNKLAEPWTGYPSDYQDDEVSDDALAIDYEEFAVDMDRAIRNTELERPRILLDADGFDRLRDRVANEPATARIFEHFLAQADEIFDEPVLEREQIGRRMLGISREAVRRMVLLGLAWQVTGDQHYADRIAEELRAVSSFSDWNPSHFLDVAEMTLAVSIGYDWTYDVLDNETREMVRTALVKKGLEPGLTTSSRKWTTNWGQVVNGGLSAGAIALLDEEPEIARQTLMETIHNVRYAARSVYAPEGNYMEGAGYWNFGTFYYIIMIEVLETVFGSDFGLKEEPGFKKSGEYMLHVTGSTLRTYTRESERRSTPLVWFANRYHLPLIPEWSNETAFIRGERLDQWTGSRSDPFALIWLPDADFDPISIHYPRDWFGRGAIQVAMHRSGWDDPDALFVGIKSGIAHYSHGYLDAGDFVLDAGGVRWAMDRVALPSYHSIEQRDMSLWNYEQDSDRWRIFHYNNFSHNTLVIDGKLQVPDGQPVITEQSSSDDFPYTLVDLSEVYAGQAEKVTRTFAMPERRAVMIVDDIKGLDPGAEVRWAMATDAAVKTDGKEAVLTKNGRSLRLKIAGDTNFYWSVGDLSDPPEEWDIPDIGSSLLHFVAVAPDEGDLLLQVHIVPDSSPDVDDQWWESWIDRLPI